MWEIQLNRNGTCLAIVACSTRRGPEAKELNMVRMIKKVGDRELAWVMLAVAAVALWSTWGLTS